MTVIDTQYYFVDRKRKKNKNWIWLFNTDILWQPTK